MTNYIAYETQACVFDVNCKCYRRTYDLTCCFLRFKLR